MILHHDAFKLKIFFFRLWVKKLFDYSFWTWQKTEAENRAAGADLKIQYPTLGIVFLCKETVQNAGLYPVGLLDPAPPIRVNSKHSDPACPQEFSTVRVVGTEPQSSTSDPPHLK